jgi:hypothetical protein
MSLTDDKTDPRLREKQPNGQNQAYLVLSDEERSKGFVRAVRRSYVHVGPGGPANPLRELTEQEKEWYAEEHYVRYEDYPENARGVCGRFWTQADLDRIKRGCGGLTTMALEIAETYARNPTFYSGTFCTSCGAHYPVEEFVWKDTQERVGS